MYDQNLAEARRIEAQIAAMEAKQWNAKLETLGET